MTQRKNKISIYNYPEHLNPFREDADDRVDKFSTTGRRRSSFRINKWNVFSPNKGKSKDFEDINPVSPSATRRFMTWTPQLIRKASFLRSSPSRSSVGPREMQTSTESRLSFKPNPTQCRIPPSSSRSSLPPTSSRPAPHSNSSRSTLPPNHNLDALPYSRTTSPPSGPTRTNVRTSLSPGRPFSPGPITLAETTSTENAPNNVNTGSKHTTPVPAVCEVSFPASASENTVGEQPSTDETKYKKQGAKPKQKRRAPDPPISSPGKSTSDIPQLNPNEADVSVTLSVIECSAEDPPHQEIPTATSHLEVITQEPQHDTKNRESHDSCIRKSDHLHGEQILNTEKRTPKLHSDNEADESKGIQQDPQQLEPTHVNGHSEGGDEIDDRVHTVRKGDKPPIVESVLKKQVQHAELHDDEGTDDYLELQSALENELREYLIQLENENFFCQQDWKTENTQRRDHFDYGVQAATTDTAKNKYKLHNGKNLSENIGLRNGEELKIRNTQQIEKNTAPEPKPRIVRPNM